MVPVPLPLVPETWPFRIVSMPVPNNTPDPRSLMKLKWPFSLMIITTWAWSRISGIRLLNPSHLPATCVNVVMATIFDSDRVCAVPQPKTTAVHKASVRIISPFITFTIGLLLNASRAMHRCFLRSRCRRPSSAQGFIELDNRHEMQSARGSQRQFGVEEVALRNEHIQIIGDPAGVAQIRQMQRRLQRLDLLFLCRHLFNGGRHRHQRVLHFSECDQDRLFILGNGLTRLGFSRFLLKA